MTLVLYLAESASAVAKDKDIYFVTSDSPIIHEELGVALLPHSILAQGTENIYQSIFLKLETPVSPTKVCNLQCTPNMTEVTKMVSPPDGCWIEKMAVSRTTILQTESPMTREKCLVLCLVNSQCGVLTYDPETSTCIIQTGSLYRVNALDDRSTSATARLDCLLENNGKSRSGLCKNENVLFTAILEAMNSQLDLLTDRYIGKFQDVKAAYDIQNLSSSTSIERKGRAWEDLDFLVDVPIIGHFYEILKSPSENRKMREHLNELAQQFVNFASVVEEELISRRAFDNDVLELIEAGFGKVYQEIEGLKCDITSIAALTIFQQTLKIHESKLDEMFFATKHGKLTASLPQTLSLDDLNLILEGNPNFQNTIYSSRPEILYRIGDLYLMDAVKHEKCLLFHFLLTAPKLKPASLYKTYYPVQVPITTIGSELCFIPELPPTIIIHDDKLVAADTTDCTIREELILCQQDFADTFSPNVKEIPCLNSDPTKCKLTPVACENTMLFTKAGALVFSKGSILGMEVGETTKLTVLDKEFQTSYFFSWSNFKMIQSGKKVIYSLTNDLVVKNLTWRSEQTAINFRHYLAETSEKEIRANITKIKDSLDNVTALAELDYMPNFLGMGVSRRKWIDTTGFFSFIATILSLAGVIVVCCYKRWTKNSRILRLVMDTVQDDKRQRRAFKFDRVPLQSKVTRQDEVPTMELERPVQDVSSAQALSTSRDTPVVVPLEAPSHQTSTTIPKITDAYGSL